MDAELKDAISTSPGARAARDLARELSGSLPCVRCGYELQGLSVLATCPECGTRVGDTVAAAVDPLGEHLPRIDHPRLTAVGIVVWVAAATIAAVLIWAQRITDLAGLRLLSYHLFEGLPAVVAALVALSGLASAVLVVPQEGTSTARRLTALGGVVAYIPLVWLILLLHRGLDPTLGPVYDTLGRADEDRLGLRLLVACCLIAILACLRPNARALAAHSHLMRQGVVDRQTMLAMIAAVGMTMFGDAARFIGNQLSGFEAEASQVVGIMLVAIGSALFTLGLFGALFDVVHVARRLVSPAVTRSTLFASDRPFEEAPS